MCSPLSPKYLQKNFNFAVSLPSNASLYWVKGSQRRQYEEGFHAQGDFKFSHSFPSVRCYAVFSGVRDCGGEFGSAPI
mgnify:CR=1 FL=1